MWSPHASPKTNYTFGSCNIYARRGDRLTVALEPLLLSVEGIESGGRMGICRKGFFKA